MKLLALTASVSRRRASVSPIFTRVRHQRSMGGAMSEVAIATMTTIEYISTLSTPRLRPMVATMISIAPRAFIPEPSASRSQWEIPQAQAPR